MWNDLPLNIIVSRKYLPLFHTSYPPGCARCDYNEPNKKRELSNLVQLLGRCAYMYTFRQLIFIYFIWARRLLPASLSVVNNISESRTYTVVRSFRTSWYRVQSSCFSDGIETGWPSAMTVAHTRRTANVGLLCISGTSCRPHSWSFDHLCDRTWKKTMQSHDICSCPYSSSYIYI